MLLTIAIAPGLILLFYIYKMDKKDKEPIGLILKLLFFGVVSAFAATILETLGMGILANFNIEDDDTYTFILSFFCIAVAEEGAKYYYLRKKTWNSSYFNYSFDAIVYSVCVSLGFAIYENILYVSRYGFETGVIRAFTAVPGHFFDAVLMGLFYAEAAKKTAEGKSYASIKISLACALIVPIMTHGAYDYLAMSDAYPEWFFYVYLLILYVLCFSIVSIASKRDVRV